LRRWKKPLLAKHLVNAGHPSELQFVALV
jgi:hypothetical protein